MDDEPRRDHLPSTVPTASDAPAGRTEVTVHFPQSDSMVPAEASAHPPHGLRDRATAGAASLGAAALLVLSFGPTALALTPSGAPSVPPQGRNWIAPLDVEATTTATATTATTAPEHRDGQAS
ncbi:hypothetical protein [Brachybacterium sp. 107]|uniref:hypothetical protein n=1 Tax=Brachybacterium sp. 107 TaxID=3457736 RepID=UPI004034183F